MKRSTLAAVLGNVVSLLAVALVHFGVELTPEQQAEIVSAMLVIVNTVALIIPALTAYFGKRSGGSDSQAGYVRPSLCFALAGTLTIAMALGALPGCVPTPVTPQHTIAASSLVIEQLAAEVGAAQQMGQITVEREGELLDRLQVANDTLRRAAAVVAVEGDATALLQAVSDELTRIRTELAQEARP